jgi:hypothetical protein
MKNLLFIALVVSSLNCSTRIEEPLVYSREGIINFTGEPALDGCGWNIKTNEGETFYPINLTDEFMQDSLSIGILLKPLDDGFLCSFNIIIPKVEIINIEALTP